MSASTIHREMKGLANPSRAAAVNRFFKTAPGQYGAGDRFLGIRVPVLRKLAAKYQTLSLRELSALLGPRGTRSVFSLCSSSCGNTPGQSQPVARRSTGST